MVAGQNSFWRIIEFYIIIRVGWWKFRRYPKEHSGEFWQELTDGLVFFKWQATRKKTDG